MQNAEFFHLPLKDEATTAASRRLVELFIEIEPAERCEWFDSVTDAIEGHQNDSS